MVTNTLSVLQSILVLALVLWLIGLGISLITQKHKQYLQWTGKTLKDIWKNCWQLLVGIAIGYWLLGTPLLTSQ